MMKRYVKNKVIAFALAGVMLFAGVPSDVYAEESIIDQVETGLSPEDAEAEQDVEAEPEAEDTEEWVYEEGSFEGEQGAEPGAPAVEPGDGTQANEGILVTVNDGSFVDWRLDGEGTLTIAAHAQEPDRYTIDLNRLKSFDFLSEEERASISSIVFDGRDTCGRGFRVNGFDAAIFPNVRSLILEEDVTEFKQDTFSKDIDAGYTNDSITSVEVRGENVYLYVQLFRALETISVTGSVTNIFAGSCANLRQVTVNRWMGDVWQERAFMNCGSLTSFVVGETECDEISLDELFFFKCGALSELVIPSHLKEVGDCAFQNCSSLTSLPDLSRLTQIGRNAFGGCTSLAQITLPENIQIGQSAFSDCTGLLSVEIGSVDMSTPLAGVWAGCSSLQTFTIRGSGSSGVPLVLGNDSTRGNGYFHYTGCFENCSSLTEVQILAAVSEIGTDCFKNCENLTKLAGFTGLTVLDASCFENCSNLQVLPPMDTVQTIAGKAFYNCCALTEMMKLPALTQIGAYAFYGCTALTGLRAGGDSSTVIGNYVFKGCTSLVEVVFEEVQTIRGTEAFSGCTSLKQVVLQVMHAPAELKGSTFEACSALTDLDMPAGFSQLSSDFTGCSSLETIAGLERLESIRGAAFKNCSSLREIIFPEDAEMTGNTAEMFFGCGALERVVLPRNLTSLGERMFQDCSSLTAVEGLENIEAVITIGSSCFENCPLLKELRIKHASKIYSLPGNLERFVVPAEITDISYLFRNCAKLREVIIPGTVTNMSGAFQNCPLLEKVVMDEGITAIPANLFAGCTALAEVSLPETVAEIGSKAFSGCTALTRADLPETVTQIGERAFENCTSLNQGKLPDGLTSIGAYAFSGCSALSLSELPASLSEIPAGAFKESGLDGTLLLPQETLTIKGEAFAGTNLECVYFRNQKLTFAGNDTFKGDRLNSIIFDCDAVTYYQYARNIVLAPGNASVSVLRGTVDCEIKQDSESGTDNQMYVYAAPEVTQMNLRISGSAVTVDGEAGTEAERWANNNHYTFLGDESSGNPGLQDGTYSDGTFLFKAADGKATIISYLGTDQEVEVPEVLSGCVVSGLGPGVFGAKAVNLREQYVTKIHLPKTLQEAEPSAFWPLKLALPGVSYSTPVTITLDPENPYLSIDAGALYDKEKTRLITVIPGVISTEIAPSAETIGKYAFAHSNVRTVTLPERIRMIEKSAFYSSALETIDIGTGTEEIGETAFGYCRSLKYAELPESLNRLGTGAFSHCSGLEYVTAGDRLTEIGERILYESSGSFYGIEGSDFMLYLKKNHPKNAGRGFLIGEYVVGAQIEKDPSASGTDYTYLSSYGMSGYLLQLTRPVKVISGMSRYIDSKTGNEVSSILIQPTSQESRQINFLYLTSERMLPGDTTVYLSIDAELSAEFGRETISWSSEGLWKGTTKADVWPFDSPTDQIDASMLRYLVGERKAKRLQKEDDLSGKHGCCFGMAATVGMVYTGAPSLKRLGKKTMAAVLVDDRIEELNDISVKEFIQLVFLMQKLPEYDKAMNQNKNNLKGFVYDFNQYLYHGGRPLIFGYQYDKQNKVSHALLPIRWADGSVDENGEFLTNTPEMLVYDCTDIVEETRIRLYVKGGEVTGWEYPGHNAGSADHRWMKYAMIPESFYTLAKKYRQSVADPVVNYAEQKLLDFCTENAEFAKQKLSAQSGDLVSEITGDDVSGNLLIPVPSMDAAGTDAGTEAGTDTGTDAGTDTERTNYYFWVEGKDSVSIGGIPEDTGVSLTGEASDVEVTSSKTAAVILSAADTPDEVTAAVVKTEEPSAFRVAAEYNEKESPGTISAFSIEGQSDGTELVVSDEDDKVHVTGAETAVIEIRSGETVLTQKVESLSDYTSVEVELVSNPQSGEQAIVTRGDKDGDGNADEVVQPVSEGENQEGGNQGSGTQGGGTQGGASSKDTENASGNASQKPASGQNLQSAAKPAGSPVPAAEEIEAITISKKPSIKKPAASKNKITVKWTHFKHKTKKTKKIWKKIKKVQVQCASDKSFTTIVKNVRVSRKKTKAVIRGLKRKTTYYVRVRYYDGTGYSKWSKVKKIKTKA